MRGTDRNDAGGQGERLTVYEFHGAQPPSGEPHDGSFLGIWPEPPYYYLFFAGHPGSGFSHWLGRQQGWVRRNTYSLAYEEWQQLAAETILTGPLHIELVPACLPCPKPGETSRNVLRIDPGLVFGSGLHGSTRGCLLAIADLFSRIAVQTVVDMGTGTGILAAACGVLGAARILAIDKNPLAIRAAVRNIRLNCLQDRVALLVAEDLGLFKVSSDLLIMNLEAVVLRRILGETAWLDYPRVILSGFLESEWSKLKEYIPSSHCLDAQTTVDDWLTVTLARKGLARPSRQCC